jgi:hypothetical protein
MNKKFLRFDNVWLWGIFFFLILIAANWALFFSYQQLEENKGISGWVVFWNYCSTDSFKTVTISLLIPVILAFMGGIFKINDAIGERIKKAQEERINEQQDCIKEVSAMFDKLEQLTSDVRHYEKGADKKKDIKVIIRGLEQFMSGADNTFSMLLTRFPNLKDKNIGSFFTYFNVLANAATSVAYYIQNPKVEQEKIDRLQNALEVIRDSIDYMAFVNILKVLNYSVELSRGDITAKRKKEIDTDEIDYRLNYLTNWVASMAENNSGFMNDYLPSVNQEKIAEFRAIAKEVEMWLGDKKNEDKDISECPYIKCFRDAFSAIPRETLIYGWPIDYSDEDIEKLADWLGSEYMLLDVEERV